MRELGDLLDVLVGDSAAADNRDLEVIQRVRWSASPGGRHRECRVGAQILQAMSCGYGDSVASIVAVIASIIDGDL